MASQITSNTENKKVSWSVNLRPKVGQSVNYLGNEWISLSGINIEPTLVNSNDWILSTNGSQEILIFISQWNAETNTPELIDGDKNKFREAYISLNAFTRFGIGWEKGDYLVYDINGDIFKEPNPLLNIVSTVGFSNEYDDLDNAPTFKTVENLSILGTGNIDLTKTMVGLGNVDNTSDADKPISDDTQTALNDKADLVGGTVPANQLPSYVDDVLEFANLASFPATGENGKIYIALDDNKQYRWAGSDYLQITNGLIASTNDLPEGSNNLYFTGARALASLLTNFTSFGSASTISATDSIFTAFRKLAFRVGVNDDKVTNNTDASTLDGLDSTDLVRKTGSTMTGKLILNNGLDLTGMTFNELGTGNSEGNHLKKYENVKTYVSGSGNVAGKIRVELPITSTTTWSMTIDLFDFDEYSTNNREPTRIQISGTGNSNIHSRSVWTNNPDRISRVEWGRNLADTRTVLLISPYASNLIIPKVTISEVLTHHSFSAGMSNSSNYAIDITTDETDFNLQGTILNSGFIRDSYYAAKTDYATATTGGTVKMRISGSDLFITNNGTNP